MADDDNWQKWDAQRARDALLEYMRQRGLKRYRPGDYTRSDTEGLTIFHDGSGLAIEIRLGLPAIRKGDL